MTDETVQTTNVSAAIAAGVAQALLAAGPTIAMSLAASDPKVQAAITIALALEPSVKTLIEQFNNQSLSKEDLDAKLADLKVAAAHAHDEWLAAVGVGG